MRRLWGIVLSEPERALNQLEPLLRMPYHLSPDWLRIDPTFAPLLGNPCFERRAVRLSWVTYPTWA